MNSTDREAQRLGIIQREFDAAESYLRQDDADNAIEHLANAITKCKRPVSAINALQKHLPHLLFKLPNLEKPLNARIKKLDVSDIECSSHDDDDDTTIRFLA